MMPTMRVQHRHLGHSTRGSWREHRDVMLPKLDVDNPDEEEWWRCHCDRCQQHHLTWTALFQSFQVYSTTMHTFAQARDIIGAQLVARIRPSP